MNALEEHSGSVYTGHQIIEAVGPGQIVSADHLDYMIPSLRIPKFRILILYIFHALCHFVTKNLCTHIRQYTARYCTLFFYLSRNVSQEIL